MQIKCIMILFHLLYGILSVHIRVIPEYIWGRHLKGNFTARCSIQCIWDDKDSNMDAVFNIVMNNPQIMQAVARSHLSPINIIGCGEGQHYYNLISREYLRAQHQVSALLDRKSDIPWMKTVNFVAAQKIPQPPKAESKAFFASRNCSPKNQRNGLVKSIMEHIPVDSLSSCMNNGKWPSCGEVLCSKIKVAARYKLLLAFENGDSSGYVTEKIYDGYSAGVLPVYYGTKEARDVVPRGSYIDVSDFDSFAEVGLYLKKVLENETLYNSYFDWKKQPLDPNFISYMEPIWSTSVQCRVCKFVDTMMIGLEWDQIMQQRKTKYSNTTSYYKQKEVNMVPSKSIEMAPLLFYGPSKNPIDIWVPEYLVIISLVLFLFAYISKLSYGWCLGQRVQSK